MLCAPPVLLAAAVLGFVNESGSDDWRVERFSTSISNRHWTALSVEGHARGDRFEPGNWAMRMFDWERFETVNKKLVSELYSTPRPDLVFARAFTRDNSLGLWGIRDAAKRPVAILENRGGEAVDLSIAIGGEFVDMTMAPKSMAVYVTTKEKVFPQPATAYDFKKLRLEKLGRGVVAFRSAENEAVVSWRYRMEDPANLAFNVYRDGLKISEAPVSRATFFKDGGFDPGKGAMYAVRAVLNGKESRSVARGWKIPPGAPVGYIPLKVSPPPPWKNPDEPDKEPYRYRANDCSVGDLDGDGELELVVKWDACGKDNAHFGRTAPVFYEGYCIRSQKSLWRLTPGKNVRSGPHYDEFMVFDLDGDGIAEIAMRTSDGAVDGRGKTLGDPSADHIDKDGQIRTAPEFLTVFSGKDGRVLANVPYDPPFVDGARWSNNSRDNHNRGFRFLACVAYLDGIHPSLVMCRGYYDRSVLTAWDWNGKSLAKRWQFDSWREPWKSAGYSGQGNHNLRVADVDFDGKDEIIYGQMAVDDDGKGLHTTRLGHGDAINLIQISPYRRGLQVWSCLESGEHGLCFRDAATGRILKRIASFRDTPRAVAADVDPELPGTEFWGPWYEGFYSANFNKQRTQLKDRGPGQSFLAWWTGDMTRSWLAGCRVGGYDGAKGCRSIVREFEGCAMNNGSKDNPCFSGDILGDWREEIILRNAGDPSELRLFVSDIPTDYRFWTFLQDPPYRISLATESVGYNQPPQPGFYFGPDLLGHDIVFRGTFLP